MKIAYYLNPGRKKNLYCRIGDGAERVSFSLGYSIDPKEWSEKQEEGPLEDPYRYTLISFKAYLSKRYHELKALEIPTPNVLATLKHEAETFVDGSGIEGIARKMFDDANKSDGLPSYDQFIQAFEKHSGLKKGAYKAQIIDNMIRFYVKDEIFEIDTYAGLSARLKTMIDGKSYDEIYLETDETIWSEVYIDSEFEKHVFLPQLLVEWEEYWGGQYSRIKKDIGKTDHLDAMKNTSWRSFQVFMECYDDGVDIIKLAFELDDSILYPIVVVTMLKLSDPEICFDEYCEMEFYHSDEWEPISLLGAEEEEESEIEAPVFFIRTAEL